MTAGSDVVGAASSRDGGSIESPQLDDGRGRRDEPFRDPGRRLIEVLGTPGHEHQQGPTGKPPGEVVERFQGGAVGPRQVIDPQAARHGAGGQRGQAVGDGRHEPGVGAGAVGAGPIRSSARIDGRQQASQLGPDARILEPLQGARCRRWPSAAARRSVRTRCLAHRRRPAPRGPCRLPRGSARRPLRRAWSCRSPARR